MQIKESLDIANLFILEYLDTVKGIHETQVKDLQIILQHILDLKSSIEKIETGIQAGKTPEATEFLQMKKELDFKLEEIFKDLKRIVDNNKQLHIPKKP
jgi:hypothetical protein